ncbi:MAG: discoidin domain-containing protein, partial [Oscillospiraceae bacterium]
LKLALSFDEANSSYEYLDVPDAPAGQWNTATFDLADYAGRTLQGINLYFESEADIADFSVNIGEIAVTDSAADTEVAPPSNASVEESMMNNKGQPEFRMTWDKSPDADVYQYEVYKVNADGTREFLGATANNALFVQDFSRDSDAPTSAIEVVAMDHAYNRSTAAETLFIWGTSSGEEVERNNLALNKPVVASKQISSAESAEKAVDGKIKGNSKWCVGNPANGNWIRVDLGETKTIRQYRLINAGHPDAGEASSMNTRDWRLEVSDDDRTYTVVSTVRGNVDNAPDIILDAPVDARYVRLTVDAAEQGGQGAIRLYEFEVYDEVYTVQSKAIAPKNVTVTNGPGSEDSVVVTGLGEGDVVQLYDTIEEGAAPLAVSAPVQAGETSVTITEVGLEKKGGILYFGRVSPNKALSPLNAKVYAAEESQGPAIHGVPETGASRTAVTLTTDEEVLFKVNGVLADRYATSIKISMEGSYTVTAIDRDGEESIAYTFAIDRTKPVLSANVSNGTATRDDVTVTANEDVLFTVNGVADTMYSTSKTFTQDGAYVVQITDRAGNYGGGIRFTIHKGKPVLEGVPATGITSGRVTLTANERVLYYVNGELASEVYNYRISFVNEGSYEVKAVNGLGSETTVQFTIDRTKPSMTASVAYGQTTNQGVVITADEDVLFSVNGVESDGYQSATISEGRVCRQDLGPCGQLWRRHPICHRKTGPTLRAVIEAPTSRWKTAALATKTSRY